MPSTLSSAATKCISEVPGLVKHTLTPPATSVRARLSAPFIEVSSGSVAVVERGHDGLRGHQIEMPAARVLEAGDVVGAEPSRHPAADQVVEIAPHVLPRDRACPGCSHRPGPGARRPGATRPR